LFNPTDEQLAEAIDRSSFARLREQEEKDGFRERPEKAERFFREGRAGQWKDRRRSSASSMLMANRCSASAICRYSHV